jgi:hypothetical protein
MKKDTDNLIVNLSLEFALDIITLVEKLEELKKYVIARQLLKSGPSIGANIREAQNAESKADFIHKMELQPRKQMKQNTGCSYANYLIHTHLMINYIKTY